MLFSQQIVIIICLNLYFRIEMAKQSESIQKAVENRINRMRNGTVVIPRQFSRLGTDVAIRTALQRLCAQKKLVRLTAGVYLLPKKDPILGFIYPSLEEIAEAIAKRDGAKIRPTGVFALNQLGLSTQVPTNHVYITNGQHRVIKVGKAKILFKHAAPKKFETKGKISSLLIPALEALGKDHLTEAVSNKVKELIAKEKPLTLERDLQSAPGWVRKYIMDLQKKGK